MTTNKETTPGEGTPPSQFASLHSHAGGDTAEQAQSKGDIKGETQPSGTPGENKDDNKIHLKPSSFSKPSGTQKGISTPHPLPPPSLQALQGI